MIRIHHKILPVFALTIAPIASAVAQIPSSVSAVHTVSVTVPPRVHAQVAPAATVSETSTTGAPAHAIVVSVKATSGWVLAIAKGTPRNTANPQWSRDAHAGYASVSDVGSAIARGAFSPEPVATTVFLRDQRTAGANQESPFTLTVVAP